MNEESTGVMGGMLFRHSHYLSELGPPPHGGSPDVRILDRYRINKKERGFNRNEISGTNPTPELLLTAWKLPLSLAELIEDS